MASCCYKVKKKRKRKLILLSVFLFIAIAVYAFTALAVRPVIRTLSRESVRSITMETVNDAVSEIMENNPIYADLTVIQKDETGNITLISANTSAINSLARGVTKSAYEKLSDIIEEGIPIPIGSVSGISFFAGRGPNLRIQAIPVGNIDTNFISEFTPAGINQTLHKLFMEVTATVHIIIPGAENKVTTITQVLIEESIIIGKIPDVYLGTQTADVTYNLVP